MQACILRSPAPIETNPLELADIPKPVPTGHQALVRVSACGICRTDLHVIEGELPPRKSPITPGHQVVGVIEAAGDQAKAHPIGARVGIAWLHSTDGSCEYCKAGKENLCDHPTFTGYTVDGGYAEYALAEESFLYAIPEGFADLEAAPLLCAGIIGFRSLRLSGIKSGGRLGLYGFGAAGHIVAQVALWQGREIYAFTRKGDTPAQDFARELGATWTGASDELPDAVLDAAIIYAPVGELVPLALRAVRKGGRVVCAGIHMSDIPSIPYHLLWEERQLVSVANLTRQDGLDFLKIVPKVGIRTQTTAFPLFQANEVIDKLRNGEILGAAVLKP